MSADWHAHRGGAVPRLMRTLIACAAALSALSVAPEVSIATDGRDHGRDEKSLPSGAGH